VVDHPGVLSLSGRSLFQPLLLPQKSFLEVAQFLDEPLLFPSDRLHYCQLRGNRLRLGRFIASSDCGKDEPGKAESKETHPWHGISLSGSDDRPEARISRENTI